MTRDQKTPGFDTDVLIVGGGPIGLTTAIALRHHGIDCTVLEQRTKTRDYSRANNLWARPQELLAGIGLRDVLAEKAYPVRKINFFMKGTPAPTTRIDEVDSAYPQVLYSGQDVIESVMLDELSARGGRLKRGQTVKTVGQDDDGVTVTMETEDGQTTEMRARYCVAADGAQSSIRGQIGLDFPLERFEGRMNRQGDAKLSWRRSTEPDQLWFFYYDRGFCGIMPVWGGYHRLFFLSDDSGLPDRDPTLDELQAIAREVTRDDTLTLSDPIWLTHSRFQHGHAARYGHGRVLLAGDAGHLSLPIGGQGMNSGLHDAVGLAWRLAMTLRGTATPVVLDSYIEERATEHARLDDQQAKGFRRSVYRGAVSDAVLETALQVVPGVGSLLQGTGDLQQLTVRYPDSPLNEDRLTRLGGLAARGGAAPGDRAPDAEVQHGTATVRLHDLIQNPDGDTTGWSLLLFDGRDGTSAAALRDAVGAMRSFATVHPRLVLAGPRVQGTGALVLDDMDGKAHRAYGLDQTPALLLVRPDGHVAFRAPAGDLRSLVAYCRRIFGTDRADPSARPDGPDTAKAPAEPVAI